MNMTELKTKSKQELKELLLNLLNEQFQLRMQKGMTENPKTHVFAKVRKDIARVHTILNQDKKK
ncbi:MAG: hypothetical protein ACD_42C00334G0002 [uncultured bacterium]|nr:MAG: hypothetical protein ACD_42C00334G0002 [uncultured bacterium]OGT32658.1 MAG: 50S ribosomal protein L29 [Gammaproteobacteria bacterium RIFCSPHIGHO2_02_FULL_39_13]OGT48623.1 MAG: 50S ribosomal protein L29 [Gammaproteobacteria bacterium RIFCSPHIGHO2_12_FULL_39_24]